VASALAVAAQGLARDPSLFDGDWFDIDLSVNQE
jgi:hypothetical protein